MADQGRTVPEIYETALAECLPARTQSLSKYSTTLGPPDLCHITKVQERPQSLLRSGPAPPTVVGTYHYVYGVECSSPAAIAAYFNTLVNDFNKPAGTSKGSWKIQSGTYCCYNAFTRVDVRVEVTMPGSVSAYVLDSQGRRYGCDDRMWQEVLVSSVLRALSKPSSFSTHIDGLRCFSPFVRPEDEDGFLRAAAELFFDGRFLGTDELAAPVTAINNRLAVGLKKYFLTTCRFSKCMDFFLPLLQQDPEIAAIIAEALAHFDQAPAAVCMLSQHLTRTPKSSAMLIMQSKLLVKMNEPEKALQVAKYAVDISPAQAQPWINLSRAYVANNQFPMALIALNVAPMAHGADFSMPDMPDPARVANINEVIRDMVAEEEEGDQTLLSLPANALRGTFLDAYHVLTLMLRNIAWDELLNIRSQVFLMEDPSAVGQEGKDGEGEAKGESVPGGKRLLERWLDQLFTALYQDLMCNVIWNAQEQHAVKSQLKLDHTVGDLLRYGYLSLRLDRKEDAVKAFQHCTSQGFCLRGLLAILEMYAKDGAVEETLATVDAVCQFYDINPDLMMNSAACEAVYQLVGRYGLAFMNQLGGKWVTKSGHVKKCIDSAMVWKVQGYDK